MNKKRQTKIVEKHLADTPDGRTIFGYAYPELKKIEINKNLRGKTKFRSYIHELLHIAYPDSNETNITAAEKVIADGLWQAGYRWTDLKNR